MSMDSCTGCKHFIAPSMCLAENTYDLRSCKQNELTEPPSVVIIQKILPQEGLNNVIPRTTNSTGQDPTLHK